MSLAPRVRLRLAQRSLLVHKLRSGLSVLGVVFGVAAVTAVSAVGEGARREAIAQIGSLGIDGITVRSRRAAEATALGLTLADATAVRAVVPHLVATAPVREGVFPVQSGSTLTEAPVVGTTPAYGVAARLRISAGRFLADLDVSDGKRVAALGASVAGRLFPVGEAVGQRIQVSGDWYEVVGVVEGRSTGNRPGAIRTRDVNRAIFVPLPALDRGKDPRPNGIDEIVLRVDDAANVTPAAEVARRVVHRTSGGAPVDVIVPREILRQRERTQRVFRVVTGAIASISLIVGGIGIMNIMLASVAERTREVGIRRAVGASRRDIAGQFLLESSLLTVLGGVLGALLGVGASALIQALAGWATALSAPMLLTAVLAALAVGIGFGFYPAWQAANLEPMEALRRE